MRFFDADLHVPLGSPFLYFFKLELDSLMNDDFEESIEKHAPLWHTFLNEF
jgi:DNA-binding transcriptional regulator YbjK